jgi:uncharacterized oligopeptide transporter (OPT) family protein
MTKNMGLVDRVVRILVAAVVAYLYISGVIGGWQALVLGIVAVVFVVTSAMGFCPGYVPFKINTCRK